MRIITKTYRVPELATGRYVKQTCTTLYQVLKPLYLPDMTAGRWREITTDFENLSQFGNCNGAIDGKHVYRGPKQIRCHILHLQRPVCVATPHCVRCQIQIHFSRHMRGDAEEMQVFFANVSLGLNLGKGCHTYQTQTKQLPGSTVKE